MIILSIDPAIHTGYALIRTMGSVTDVYEYGHIDVDTSSEYQGHHCISLMDQIQHLIHLHSVDQVCIEDYFFSNKFRSGSNVNAAFRTAIHILCVQNEIPYHIVNISSWKTFIAGKQSPTKSQKVKWGKDLAKKLFIQEALWKKYQIRFPNYSISHKTKKPIDFRLDIVDAVAIGIYYTVSILKLKKVTFTAPILPDIEKKSKKKMFDYDNGS